MLVVLLMCCSIIKIRKDQAIKPSLFNAFSIHFTKNGADDGILKITFYKNLLKIIIAFKCVFFNVIISFNIF